MELANCMLTVYVAIFALACRGVFHLSSLNVGSKQHLGRPMGCSKSAAGDTERCVAHRGSRLCMEQHAAINQ